MNRVVLDNRFFLMWLVGVVASFFSVEVQDWGGGVTCNKSLLL
ncbi:hypothetical protein [Helicobacter suis]|nr:hypothetical protein [Helicobacter suis]